MSSPGLIAITKADGAGVEAAAERLASGGLVALPTETVYGLGADARNPRAVARVYAVKGRPADHPLIVHIASGTELEAWAVHIPDYARRLALAFWPGPLTLILARSAAVGDFVTGGQTTVALRAPDHSVAQAVLERFGGGIAAPSANRFGRVSPTTAEHVQADIGERLDAATDLILDGGACRIGVESTIVDCTGPAGRILRPGAIGVEQVEALIGPLTAGSSRAPRVPGGLRSHYAPNARLVLADAGDASQIVSGLAGAGTPPSRIGFLALADEPRPDGVVRLIAPRDAREYARDLYRALREADYLDLAVVVAVPPTGSSGAAVAVRDRLRRAAAHDAG
ncbi:MAG: L-threonylcarbamoyladenylate synthase [Candidatus Nanopelagicales bacterium]|nr:L-threonylcarbamoyladenylate synthase [Candidatus Nanopelagicales bacterium]MDZ4248687.1 L-threonylcarbamoyladenylate synthase [Candidatus Nanopelagicales bacterium]MDZ7576918.1 L-threonylcarbamoyladenylate synthase [Candidatus Nanopelagicales bacterium]